MMKVLLGRVLPIGAAAALLASSASPLQPALNAFTHAANALGGAQNVDTSDVVMPDEESVNAALGEAATGGFSLTKMFKNLFGPSDSDRAKAQLAQIIANVKGRSPAGQPGLTPDGQRAGGGKATATASAGKAAAGGKRGSGKSGGKAAAKGSTTKSPAGRPSQGPEPAPDPAAPADPSGGGGEGQAAAAGGGEEGAP